MGMKHDVKSSKTSKNGAVSNLFAFPTLLHHHIAALLGFAATKPLLTTVQGENMGRGISHKILHSTF